MQIAGRVAVDMPGLYRHAQNASCVLAQAAGRFQGVALLGSLERRQQVARFQISHRAGTQGGEQMKLHAAQNGCSMAGRPLAGAGRVPFACQRLEGVCTGVRRVHLGDLGGFDGILSVGQQL
ncbi:hypothetical protein D3C78_1355780 [compost metagenome]